MFADNKGLLDAALLHEDKQAGKEKFTQGEWSINQNSEFECRWAIDTGGHLRAIDVVVCMEGGEQNESERKRLEANAHLIAAAPDMYRELCSILNSFEVGDSDHFQINDGRIPELKKLLAKARGES